jgi:hypothetical protein
MKETNIEGIDRIYRPLLRLAETQSELFTRFTSYVKPSLTDPMTINGPDKANIGLCLIDGEICDMHVDAGRRPCSDP